jgi:hypothetical protein
MVKFAEYGSVNCIGHTGILQNIVFNVLCPKKVEKHITTAEK